MVKRLSGQQQEYILTLKAYTNREATQRKETKDDKTVRHLLGNT